MSDVTVTGLDLDLKGTAHAPGRKYKQAQRTGTGST